MSIIPDCYYYYRQEREGQDISVTDHRLFVHFPIFEWLNEKVGVWADGEIESYLLKCKINTHLFALSRLDKKFVRLYVAHAAHDVCGGKARLKLRNAIRIVRSGGVRALHLMVRCFFFPNVKKPKTAPYD
jgi:hypothetical protein